MSSEQGPDQPPGWAAPGGGPTGGQWSTAQWQYAPPPPPQPGVIPLRPLGIGELLDGAFTTIRRYPKATLGITAVISLIVTVIRVVTSYYLLHDVSVSTTSTDTLSINGDYLARTSTLDFVLFVVTLFTSLVLTGIITVVVGQGVLGRPANADWAWKQTRPLLWRLLGVTLLLMVIYFAVLVVGVAPGLLVLFAGAKVAGVLLMVLGGIAAFVVDVYLGVAFLLAQPAVMLEKQRVTASLRRSRELVRGSWWRVFGIFLLASLLAEVVAGLISAPFAFASGISDFISSKPSEAFGFWHLFLAGIGSLLASIVVRPFASGVLALLYVDRRIRSEGFDITLQQATQPKATA